MGWTTVPVAVEDIDISLEQENTNGMRVLPYDGSGQYNADRTMRYINWRDADDDDEYPYQHGQWYPVGTKIMMFEYRH